MGDHHAFHVDVVVGAVVNFQPVRKIAVFVRHGGIVGAHDLADDQSFVLGVPNMTARLFGKDQIHQRQQRYEDQKKRQVRQVFILALFRSVVPRRAAFGLSRGIILHAQGLLSFLYVSQSSPVQGACAGIISYFSANSYPSVSTVTPVTGSAPVLSAVTFVFTFSVSSRRVPPGRSANGRFHQIGNRGRDTPRAVRRG